MTITPITKNMLIVAGDVSGDLHAANLIKALKTQDPDLKITAIGGKLMEKEADEFLFDLASKGASGFVEPLKKMPMWVKLLSMIREYMETQNPIALVVVDFYGFNHQVLGLAAHRNIPAYYYVTPQVWASRQYRAKRLAALTRKMFVIYPFEPAFHQKFGGKAVFFVIPLLDIMPDAAAKTYAIQDPKNHPWKLGMLPGSRMGEITRLTPVFYQAFKKVLKSFPNTQAYLFALPSLPDKVFLDLLGEKPHPHFHIVRDEHYAQRAQMDYLLCCSGTATLESALLGVPMLVAYKLSWPTYKIAKMVIKVNYISLVNLLAEQKPLVKEFIQQDATATALAAETTSMFQNPKSLEQMHQKLLELRASLGEKGVAQRAAADILEDLKK